MRLNFFKNTMHMCIIPSNKVFKILGKGKYTSHTIAHLTIFTRAFCHTHVENLLKGPAKLFKILGVTYQP